MGAPNPLPWPQSAQVVPIRRHKLKRVINIPDGEITLTRWDDGEEELTIRAYCGKTTHCGHCDCDSDHVIRIRPYEAARILALLHELTENA